MSAVRLAVTGEPRPILYPDCDGNPMAENTVQYRWIVTLKENIDALVPDFVAADLLWYPVEGDPKTRQAPDVLVAFGRPKGDRGSYKQWEEGGVPLTVVIEVLSPGNTLPEMVRKFSFYDRYGVEEYYVFDPDDIVLTVYQRRGGHLVEVENPNGWVSPRLGIRFQLGEDLEVFAPDGARFLTWPELAGRLSSTQSALTETQSALTETQSALEQERRRAEALAARLAALGATLV